MSEISAQNISFSFGDLSILENASFEIFPGEKVGLVGPNGCGKTTLLNILTGALVPESGTVSLKKGCAVGLLRQLPVYDDDVTAEQVLRSAFERLEALGRQINELTASLERGEKVDMRALGELQTAFENAGGYDQELNYTRMVSGLKISEEMQKRPFMKLSGGEKTRVNLARIMLSNPDILLLDEPTNHLDIDSVEWLEDFILSFKGSVLTVSHDRYFLDRVTTRTIELYDKKLISYPGNYSFFAEKRSEQAELLEKAKARQDKEIGRLQDAADRMKIWGLGNKKVMKKAFAIQKRIERMERIQTIKKERRINAHFSLAARSGDEVFNLERLEIGYGSPLLTDFSTQVFRGERIAVLGPNGCGKTTLLETLMQISSPKKGFVIEGSGVKKGYLPQTVVFSVPERSVLDTVLFETGFSTQEARDRLAIYGFRGEEVFKTVADLSGGEKTRLKLCLFMSRNVNTLLLDEPTNHLDIMSRSWIEDAIDEFSETLIFVSHDRYFIDRFATRIWLFENGRIFDFDGGWEALREELKRRGDIESAEKEKVKKEQSRQKTQAPVPEKKPDKGRLSQKEKRQITAKISLLEKELAEVSEELEKSASDYVKLGELIPKKDELETALLELYELAGQDDRA